MADRARALEGVVMTPAFWQGKKVLLTGHTGFKGSWLSLWLQALGARVTGSAVPVQMPQERGRYTLSVLKISDDGRVTASSSVVVVQ